MFNLLTLFDDIAATMDDVAVMTKVALKKTSALMTDDLAVNAGVISGVEASRELPIVGSIFLGSLINKVICIFIVLGLQHLYPPFLTVLLLLGASYLAYEGANKVIEKFRRFKTKEKKPHTAKKTEKERIWGAVKTDFVLSMEIIVLALTEITGTFIEQSLTLCAVGLFASIIIYGLVALLVKIDDLGILLLKKGHNKTGSLFIDTTPYMMKGLGLLGTTAMLMVAGGIYAHSFHLNFYIWEHAQNLIVGLIAGTLILTLIKLIRKFILVK